MYRNDRFAPAGTERASGGALRGLEVAGETMMERRTLPAAEVRVGGTAKAPTIQGYAIRYNELSEPLNGFREKIAPGAVKLSDDVLALRDHDTKRLLGRTSAGTL